MKSRSLLLFLVAALTVIPAFAQSTTGTLVGTVTHDGSGLPGATVTVSSPSLQGVRTAYTNENGNYVFPNLPPGDYKVTASVSGCWPVSQRFTEGFTEGFTERFTEGFTEGLT